MISVRRMTLITSRRLTPTNPHGFDRGTMSFTSFFGSARLRLLPLGYDDRWKRLVACSAFHPNAAHLQSNFEELVATLTSALFHQPVFVAAGAGCAFELSLRRAANRGFFIMPFPRKSAA